MLTWTAFLVANLCVQLIAGVSFNGHQPLIEYWTVVKLRFRSNLLLNAETISIWTQSNTSKAGQRCMFWHKCKQGGWDCTVTVTYLCYNSYVTTIFTLRHLSILESASLCWCWDQSQWERGVPGYSRFCRMPRHDIKINEWCEQTI